MGGIDNQLDEIWPSCGRVFFSLIIIIFFIINSFFSFILKRIVTRNDYYNDYFDEVLMSIITKTIILIMIINYTIVANVTKDIKYNIIQTLVQVHQLSPCNSSEYQTMINHLSLKRYCPPFPLKLLPLYCIPIHKQI